MTFCGISFFFLTTNIKFLSPTEISLRYALDQDQLTLSQPHLNGWLTTKPISQLSQTGSDTPVSFFLLPFSGQLIGLAYNCPCDLQWTAEGHFHCTIPLDDPGIDRGWLLAPDDIEFVRWKWFRFCICSNWDIFVGDEFGYCGWNNKDAREKWVNFLLLFFFYFIDPPPLHLDLLTGSRTFNGQL